MTREMVRENSYLLMAVYTKVNGLTKSTMEKGGLSTQMVNIMKENLKTIKLTALESITGRMVQNMWGSGRMNCLRVREMKKYQTTRITVAIFIKE